MSFRVPYTVSRPGAGSYVRGVWVGAAPATFTIQASAQPADGKTRENPPEGYDSKSVMVLYTDTALQEAQGATVAMPAGRQSDYVTLFGERYDVIAVSPWQNGVISHYRVVVARPKG